ncbi:MAG: FtsX-like permease family protein [Proteobacteria bacterium]|nr:FtsX-like permease family protein [Pseudomonadota bacterium]MDA0993022.1 FtsX-like permease family protein [Pseudomonadota bacterium]
MKVVQISFLLASRNLWRNYRRTIIMLVAISVGAWAMIFMTALMRGMVNEMLRDGIRSLPGLVQVHNSAYRDDPSINNLVSMTDIEIETTFAAAGIERYATRVRVPAIISSERESRGVTLLGVDPLRERSIEAVGSVIAEGRGLESIDDNGIVIGKKLAGKLDTEIGKRIVLMSQDPDNEVADRGFRVVGLFEANLAAQEEAFVFAGRTVVQKMLGIDGRVSEIALTGDDYRNVELLLADTRRLMDGRDEVLSWQELDTFLGTMLGVMDGFVLVWIVVIFLALSFGLVNTLVMAVFERVREIGLMLALGMRPSGIMLQIIFESLLLLMLGLSIGNALAYASVIPLKDGLDISVVAEGMEMFGAASVLYPEIQVNDVVLANVVVLTLGLIASLSPAWRASRYEPVKAITKV